MVSHALRDRERLNDMSNFVIWRAKILTVLDEYNIKDYAKNVLVVPTNADPLK